MPTANSSTQWRLFCHTPQSGGANMAVAALKMHTSFGGADICTGGTVSASYVNGSYPPSNAFDSNAATFWWTAAQEQWIQYTFPTSVAIVEFIVTARNDGYYQDTPISFELQYYNGTTWVSTVSLTGQTGWTNGLERTYNANNLAYVLSGRLIEYSPIDTWRVVAKKCADNTISASGVFTGNTYQLICTTADICTISIEPKIDYAWSAGKVSVANDFVVASDPVGIPYLFKVSIGGAFGTTENPWNLSGTTTQGAATLTYIGPLVTPIMVGPRVPS